MKQQTVKVEDAVGKVLSHDITKIVKGEFKGAPYRKGHVIREEDVPELLKLGKENIYILEFEENDVHEDDAALRLAAAVTSDDSIYWTGPKESRINFFAAFDGLLKVNIPALEAINDVPDVVLSTLTQNVPVKKDEMIAGTKVIPLVVPEGTLLNVENICRQEDWIIKVVPFRKQQVGVVITGSEVYKQRIKDEFKPVITKKMEAFGSSVMAVEYAPDDVDIISGKIRGMVENGADLVIVTGGMSVDPDDVTPRAIQHSGARIEKYGAAAFPGAMFMLAYHGNVPVMGIPACGMFFKITVVDIILPRLLAGERVTRKDIVALAHGGLCRGCKECKYPNCTFGKGSF